MCVTCRAASWPRSPGPESCESWHSRTALTRSSSELLARSLTQSCALPSATRDNRTYTVLRSLVIQGEFEGVRKERGDRSVGETSGLHETPHWHLVTSHCSGHSFQRGKRWGVGTDGQQGSYHDGSMTCVPGKAGCPWVTRCSVSLGTPWLEIARQGLHWGLTGDTILRCVVMWTDTQAPQSSTEGR